MQKKIISEYEYRGLGFPILLKNVEFLKIQDQWCPKIDVEKVAFDAFHTLMKKVSISLLNGNEIEFIRNYLNMNKKEFGEKLNVSRRTISRWEKAGDIPPKTRQNYKPAIQNLENFG